MNPNVRTECLETLLNPLEMSGFAKLCQMLGVSKSAFNRSLINNAVRTHGMAPPPSRESRGCRGQRPPANRASAGLSVRRRV